ncbi:unannotated protein [freshwater metagenome]|uniref:Unannotated protein n=1 Tax=freshwater metagenome TaxID=449393 RepID=A0A6J7CFV8_9ZZZZ|nr:hypothetical protein [Actinomycetota bacterium]MTA05334.1 hypothetical protein [Actinomycetota bacterium]MTA37692.1 hypothetical protein [Actinomycetota bacterium]
MKRIVKGIYVCLVAIFVAGYVAWVDVSGFLASATMFSGSVHDQKATRLLGIGVVENVIVGGSNAVYSLSAERLSELSGETWFNAALPREGFTQENLTAFVDHFVNSADGDRISRVVVSSARHWHVEKRDRFKESAPEMDFDGIKAAPFWLPSESLWSLVSEPPAKVFPTIISSHGDIVHEAAHLCVPNLRAVNTEWATDDEIDSLLESWLPIIHSRFPNAAVVITIPSRYVVEPVDPVGADDYVGRLQLRIDAWIRAHPDAAGIEISTILETNYDDPSILCTTGPHYNAKGRLLRTDALYAAMIQKGVTDGG